METDPSVWVQALRASHDHLSEMVLDIDAGRLRGQSYCSDWTIADALSHLGSSAEIFALILSAGLAGEEGPSHELFHPIWNAWNAAPPSVQAERSVLVNEELVRMAEQLDHDQLESFRMQMFGMDLDAAKLFRMRLFEHAIHTWDIEVMLEDSATVMPYAVALLIDGLSEPAARSGKPVGTSKVLKIETTDPMRTFALFTDGVRVGPWADHAADGTVSMTSEEFIRLVYGRLDPGAALDVNIEADDMAAADLCAIFPGF